MVVGVGWLAHCWVSEGSDSFTSHLGHGPVRVFVSGCGSPSGLLRRMVGLVWLVDWVGLWFVNSGREHLVAIREFNDIARSTCECVVCGVLGLCFVSFVVVFLVECL